MNKGQRTKKKIACEYELLLIDDDVDNDVDKDEIILQTKSKLIIIDCNYNT